MRKQFLLMAFPGLVVTARDVVWVGEQLMKHEGREGWEIGARLCR